MAAPVAASNQRTNVKKNVAKTIKLNVYDPDGDTFTALVAAGNGGNVTLVYTLATLEVEITPTTDFTGSTWLEYDATAGGQTVRGGVNIEVYTSDVETININTATTHTASADLPSGGKTGLVVAGADATSILDMADFKILATAIRGDITLSNLTLRNGGGSSVAALKLTCLGDNVLTLTNVVFDDSGKAHWEADGTSQDGYFTVTGCTVNTNSLVPAVSSDSSSDSCFYFRLGNNRRYAKTFNNNLVRKAFVDFDACNDWVFKGNRLVGDRCYVQSRNCSRRTIGANATGERNFIHPTHSAGWSQVPGVYLTGTGDTTSTAQGNIVRDAHWCFRGVEGEVAYNIVTEPDGHNWANGFATGANFHHNIGALPGTTAPTSGLEHTTTTATGVKVNHNTLHGGASWTMRMVAISQNATLDECRSNLFYDYRGSDVVVGPEVGTTVSGTPPRPAADADRITTVSDNGSYHPNGTPTATFGVGTASSGGDVTSDPSLSNPITSFPYTDGDIVAGNVSVDTMFTTLWARYAPAAAAYDNEGHDGGDIGAVDVAAATNRPKLLIDGGLINHGLPHGALIG